MTREAMSSRREKESSSSSSTGHSADFIEADFIEDWPERMEASSSALSSDRRRAREPGAGRW